MSNKIVDHSDITRIQYTCLHSVYTVLFLLLVARDFEGCSCLVSYVAGDVAGYWPALVKDEIIKVQVEAYNVYTTLQTVLITLQNAFNGCLTHSCQVGVVVISKL